MSEEIKELCVHYHRCDDAYEGWTLWTWSDKDGTDAHEITPSGQDDFGVIFTVPLWRYCHTERIGLLPRQGEWKKQDNGNKYWTIDKGAEVYLVQDDTHVHTSPPSCTVRAREAWCDTRNEIAVHINIPLAVDALENQRFHVYVEGNTRPVVRQDAAYEDQKCTRIVRVEVENALECEDLRRGAVQIAINDTPPITVAPRYVADDPYFYTDAPLGALIAEDGSRVFFRTWAPCAASVRIALSQTRPLPQAGEESDSIFDMTYTGNGVWEWEYIGDIRGWYYRYDVVQVHRPDKVVSVYDPYGRAVVREEKACIIVDAPVAQSSASVCAPEDAVVYELHVRDFTIDSSAGNAYPGTYRGMIQEDTHMPDLPRVSTGLAHLRQLGVNTLQIMPLHMFAFETPESVHAWGYMTRHFNAPDPSYATDKDGATAVRECAEMVDALHAHGFRVILDVVYNHSTESATYAEHWNGLAPHYMYRLRPDGSYYNGSGCGNEFRSEGRMARRFLLDSLRYWVTAYGFDGFRFDLMGLIDHETMEMIVTTLREVKSDIMLYGEPWVAAETPIEPTVKGTQRNKGFGCFNDEYRRAIAGNVFDETPGYVWDGREVESVIQGWHGSIDSFAALPHESINLVECHDDRTLRDRLMALYDEPHDNEGAILAMHRMAAFLIVLGQGCPFLHCGQDFFRTKFGCHNSYNKGDKVNRIRWQWKDAYAPLFSFYAGLIALRTEHAIFRLRTVEEVKACIHTTAYDHGRIASECDCSEYDETWSRAVALVNPYTRGWRYTLPENGVPWHVYVRGIHARTSPFDSISSHQKTLNVPARAAMLIATHKA